MMSVLEERLAEPDCHEAGVLLDGFPRTHTQAMMLKKSKLKVSAHLSSCDICIHESFVGVIICLLLVVVLPVGECFVVL